MDLGAADGPGRRALLALRDDVRALPLRAALVAVVAVAVARLHAAYDPGVLCPLRRVTGVPCPLCGSTTAVVELGWGHVRDAVAAQPLTMALAGVMVAAPGWLRRGYRQLAVRPRLVLGCVAVLALGSWLYQWFRLHP